MKNIVIVAALATAFTAAPAFAQDFTGGRIEAQIGYDRVNLDAGPFDVSTDGVMGGIAAGFDYDLGSVVVGAEAGVAFSSAKLDLLGDELRAGRDLEVSARLGFKVSPTGMIYAKAGWTNAAITYDDGTSKFTETDDGFRIGGGYEQTFGGSTYGKLEYRYSDYGDGVTRSQIVAGVGIRF